MSIFYHFKNVYCIFCNSSNISFFRTEEIVFFNGVYDHIKTHYIHKSKCNNCGSIGNGVNSEFLKEIPDKEYN